MLNLQDVLSRGSFTVLGAHAIDESALRYWPLPR